MRPLKWHTETLTDLGAMAERLVHIHNSLVDCLVVAVHDSHSEDRHWHWAENSSTCYCCYERLIIKRK